MPAPYICSKCHKELLHFADVIENWPDIYCQKCAPEGIRPGKEHTQPHIEIGYLWVIGAVALIGFTLWFSDEPWMLYIGGRILAFFTMMIGSTVWGFFLWRIFYMIWRRERPGDSGWDYAWFKGWWVGFVFLAIWAASVKTFWWWELIGGLGIYASIGIGLRRLFLVVLHFHQMTRMMRHGYYDSIMDHSISPSLTLYP